MSGQESGLRDAFGAVQDVDEGRREVLVQIPWEVLDSHNTDFERSCFDEYLRQRLPVMCWQHLKSEPVGRVTEWQKGQRTNNFVARFSDFDAVPLARRAFVQIRDGDLSDFSFYYDRATAIRHPNTRGAIRFTKARMPEISPVTVGSIPGAQAVGVRMDFDGVDLRDDDALRAARFGFTKWPGYSTAAVDAHRRRRTSYLDVEVALALMKLGGHRSTTTVTDADLRARAATMPTRSTTPQEHEARQRQLRGQWERYEADDHLMSTPQGQRILEDRLRGDAPSYVAPPVDRTAPPGEDLSLIAQTAKERGEDPTAAVRAAQDGWRATYGEMYAKTAPTPNEPDWRGERPYPPDDLLQVAALAAADRNEDPQRAVADTIRNWRVARGFETEEQSS